MRVERIHRKIIVFAFVLAATCSARAVRAQSREACLDAAESGQRLRDDGKLVEARGKFVTCGSSSCPASIARECVRWAEDVDARVPLVVVGARDEAGRDLAVELSVDDEKVTTPSGRAIPLDPGAHVIRARAADGRTVDEKVIVREREKDRRVMLVFPGPAAPEHAADRVRPVPTPEEAPAGRSIPALSWVLGGVAVAGGVGFGVLWSGAVQDAHELRGTCAPACSESAVDDIRTDATLARVALGVGIASAIGAVVLYLVQPERPRSRGALAPVSWSF